MMFSLSGATLEEGTRATMSEDEDEPPMLEGGLDMGSDGHDMMGFGPLLPTDSERSLMERVRQELKIELKQVKKRRRGSSSIVIYYCKLNRVKAFG